MGLDNMPHAYPCKEQGTAVIEKKTHTWEDENGNTQSENSYPVDCDKTIEAGGCPYTNASPPETGSVTGMFGTYCWYRGKYGNWLINALDAPKTMNIDNIDPYGADDDASFYGTDPEGRYRPPQACRDLADQMESALNERGGQLVFNKDDRTDDVLFAIWYLRWVAKECDGMDAWY
ncbi:MAG: hypothetical protein HN341_16220 [Verrucomicrobia bacterium]|nr:hypothetical protein [Verrucomicrobiota bacterium]MBT3863129.1 hypothetical protein [Chloroflexota bacterium]